MSALLSDGACEECGHSISLHDDRGCVVQSPGTLETPPAFCGCPQTYEALRLKWLK
ncbi:MAG: hypothetical protein ACYDGM_13340 [Vulcanimicrobiaceae bacterium]